MTNQTPSIPDEEDVPVRDIGNAARWFTRIATVILLFLGTNQAFNFSSRFHFTIIENQYLYGILGLTIPMVFLLFPLRGGLASTKPTLIDWALAATAIVCLSYFIFYAYPIVVRVWNVKYIIALVVNIRIRGNTEGSRLLVLSGFNDRNLSAGKWCSIPIYNSAMHSDITLANLQLDVSVHAINALPCACVRNPIGFCYTNSIPTGLHFAKSK